VIRLIVAHDLKRGIAKHGIQPWSIPKDEAYFSTQTKLHGGRIVMGSKTFKTVQVALADRMNYVVYG
jgi:dihydrofolate reductase